MAAIPFGEFELHEAARALQHRGEAVPVQRLVLALFGYLVRNASRTVPKDELLDALWPGVHVTEASLRRAASFARNRAQGGRDGRRAAQHSPPRLSFRARPAGAGRSPLDRCVPRLAAARQCAGGSRDARLERSRGALRRDRPRRAGSARRISASGPVRSPARPAAEPPARSTSGRSRAISRRARRSGRRARPSRSGSSRSSSATATPRGPESTGPRSCSAPTARPRSSPSRSG